MSAILILATRLAGNDVILGHTKAVYKGVGFAKALRNIPQQEMIIGKQILENMTGIPKKCLKPLNK